MLFRQDGKKIIIESTLTERILNWKLKIVSPSLSYEHQIKRPITLKEALIGVIHLENLP